MFEPRVLALLDSLVFDPAATVGYEYLSGGLVWSDEVPGDVEGGRAARTSRAFKFALAYRAALTLGEERAKYRPHWEQLEREAPGWPGLRVERRGEETRRDLVARNEELEGEFEGLGDGGRASE